MAGRGRPSKYLPLTGYFAALSGDAVRLTFPEMEVIIGAALPPRARAPAFWANRSPRLLVAQPWMQAGWRMVRTELHARPPAVHFARVVRGTPAPSLRPAPQGS
jgi:hypothetical protein